jgi:hypothetical protein
MINISYAVIQYHHDHSNGEALNIGVVGISSEPINAAIRLDHSYPGLSDRYCDFDPLAVRKALKALTKRIAELNQKSNRALISAFPDRVSDARSLVNSLWCDRGSSIGVTASRSTIADSLEEEVDRLFHRLVTSYRGAGEPKPIRKDEDVWESINAKLRVNEGLAARFMRHNLGAQLGFDHTVRRNQDDRILIVQPSAFDYIREADVRDYTHKLLGRIYDATAFDEFGEMIVVVGETQREPKLAKEVQWAIQKLEQPALRTSVVKESEFDLSLLEMKVL